MICSSFPHREEDVWAYAVADNVYLMVCHDCADNAVTLGMETVVLGAR